MDNNFQLCDGLCEYYSVSEFSELCSGVGKNYDFFMLNYNIRSFNSNSHSFDVFLKSLDVQPQFIVLTETWNSPSNVNLCSILNYNSFHSHRTSSTNSTRGGGVSVFCDDRFSCEIVQTCSFVNENLESCTVKVKFDDKYLIVVGLYRPPSSSIPNFFEKIELILNNEVVRKADSILVCGDININMMDLDARFVLDYVSLMQSYRVFPVINKPTRFPPNLAPGVPTLLDHIWFDSFSYFNSGIIDLDLSDHCPTFLFYNSLIRKTQKTEKYKIQFRVQTEECISNFHAELSTIDWNFENLTSHPNEKLDIFTHHLDQLYRRHFPLKTKYISKKRLDKPWLNQRLLNQIKLKSHYFKLFRLGLITSRVNNSFKNKVNKEILFARNSFYVTAFNVISSNMRSRWNLINSLLNRNCTRKKIKILLMNGTTFSNDFDIAEKFNSFFCSVAQNLRDALPPEITPAHTFINSELPCRLKFKQITSHDCERVINQLKNSKTGIDSIPVHLVKRFRTTIAQPLSLLINESFKNGSFPDKFKLARVTAIFKKGDETNCSNYRPISSLPIFSKIIEKLVVIQLMEYNNLNSILSENQFGFQRNISTSDAVISLTEYLYQGLDNRDHNVNILIDLAKAFDTVDIPILLMKLKYYGIRGVELEWFRCYLENRRQFVSVNGVQSSISSISYGIPQGSVLGPILFLFYINDLPKVICNSSKLTLFADDTTISISHQDQSVLISESNSQLEKIHSWCLSNRLTINTSKTEILYVSNRNLGENTDQVSLGNQRLEKSKNCKFLGVTIDEKLNFKDHILSVIGKISITVGLLYKFRNSLNLDAKLNFYYSLIYPLINYNIIVWGGTYSTHLQNLINLQKRSIRIISNAPYDAHTDPLFYRLKILKLKDLFLYNLCVYMFKKVEGGSIVRRHELNTRYRNLVVPQYHRLTSTQKAVSYTGPSAWNSLPETLKTIENLSNFKKKLKTYFINQYNSDNS